MSWGPSYWRFIHYFSMNNCLDLLQKLPEFIPCEDCKTEWIEPIDSEDLTHWSLALHNKVNTKLGKYDKWVYSDLTIVHKDECDVCKKNEDRHQFPWTFIHEVAKIESPNTVSFLKEFNSTYPCLTCKGSFLPDLPNPSESVLDWTVRNHVAIDPSFKFTYEHTFPCNGCPSLPIISSFMSTVTILAPMPIIS